MIKSRSRALCGTAGKTQTFNERVWRKNGTRKRERERERWMEKISVKFLK